MTLYHDDESLQAAIEKADAEEKAFLDSLDNMPAYSQHDLWAMFEAAVESTGEGMNGEWGMTFEVMRTKFRDALQKMEAKQAEIGEALRPPSPYVPVALDPGATR